ncbi:MAG: DEAD/DEAH box helicase family protein [bacterium]
MIKHSASHDQNLQAIEQRLQALEDEKSELLLRKAELESAGESPEQSWTTPTPNEKVNLFQDFFRGRQDVHGVRWENSTGKNGYALACHNEWQPGICNKPKIKCGDCPNKAFVPLDAQVVFEHLTGTKTVGLYPLMPDSTCHLLAVDLDNADWQQAATALSNACDELDIPHAIERSRSGSGAHLWIFFAHSVPAVHARRLGFALLDLAMERYPGLSFDSYDRLFPNQDTQPDGGFGNLIALPLQHHPRQYGHSVFVDKNLVALPDQWRFLSALKKLSLAQLDGLLELLDPQSQAHDTPPWEQGLPVLSTQISGCPSRLQIVLANQLFIPVNAMPSTLLARLKRIASFANPVFFKTQAMRFSTHGIPRYISLARIEQGYLILPRGCVEDVTQLLADQAIVVEFEDKRVNGRPLEGIRFLGELRDDQQHAVNKMCAHNVGVLHAPTAFGKTVTAIGLIVRRGVSTLILTHSRELVDQWQERLKAFLEGVNVGVIRGGQHKPSGLIDIATYQSLLSRKDNTVDPVLLEYGQVIIDECHHISAPNYDRLLSEVRARYVVGLTATLERQDGHQPIILMQAGPVRHRVKLDNRHRFEQRVYVRENLAVAPQHLRSSTDTKPHIADVYRWLMASQPRNAQIVSDVITAINNGANPLVLTERRAHAETLTQLLSARGFRTVILRGAMGAGERAAARDNMATAQVLVATGKFIGEGFDLPRLDTLFLALPISWKGLLAQYAGRIHRVTDTKTRTAIYDYVDSGLPVLQRMFQRRCKGYKAMGYTLVNDGEVLAIQSEFEV